MGKINPRPTGKIEGADLPDRGVMTGVTDTYMSNLNIGESSESSITGGTKSDPAEQRFASAKPRINK